MAMSVSLAVRIAAPLAGLCMLASSAVAQDFYLSAGLGFNFQDSTSSSGLLYAPFTTGEVTGVSPPLTVPAGTPVNWSTRFDNGAFYGLALGWYYNAFRFELEYSRTDADIDGHRGFSVGGIDLSAVDAGVLTSGNVGDLGVSIGDRVANGRGDITTDTWMLNAFRDFDIGRSYTPYLGVGFGVSETSLDFRSLGLPLRKDYDQVFAWQFFAGASYALRDNMSLYANYRYRDSARTKFTTRLPPIRFDIDTDNHILDVGFRYGF